MSYSFEGVTFRSNGRKVFDFRSDTVTQPTPEMRKIMAEAPVGDDVKNEDPTVHQLQDKVAQLCQKESALFVASGTLSNQLAIRTHISNLMGGDIIQHSIICDTRSHIYKYELGGAAFHSGTALKGIEIENGKFLTAEIIERYLHFGNDFHTPPTSIISLENTINGTIFPLDEIQKIRKLADKYQIQMHLDGARLWNASIATGIPLHEYAAHFDSISLCLSKGLCAPVGSVLVGKKSFINKARQYRKLFGAGWRQAGILAAAGIYAIDTIWPLMQVDHRNTKRLYTGLLELGFEVPVPPQTNMVYVHSKKVGMTWETISQKMMQIEEQTDSLILLEGEQDPYIARLVVHQQIPEEGVDALINRLQKVLKS